MNLEPSLIPAPLWQSLAWALIATQPGTEHERSLSRQVALLSAGDKLRCRSEIAACRRAMRGETTGEVNATI